MDGAEMSKKWNKLGEAITSGMAEWRSQYPKATIREIETEIDRRLSRLRARMITDTAYYSAPVEWKVGRREAVCPTCEVGLEQKGKKKRKLQARGGQEVELEREYGFCPKSRQGIYPPG
jgi:hypothetical protein